MNIWATWQRRDNNDIIITRTTPLAFWRYPKENNTDKETVFAIVRPEPASIPTKLLGITTGHKMAFEYPAGWMTTQYCKDKVAEAICTLKAEIDEMYTEKETAEAKKIAAEQHDSKQIAEVLAGVIK